MGSARGGSELAGGWVARSGTSREPLVVRLAVGPGGMMVLLLSQDCAACRNPRLPGAYAQVKERMRAQSEVVCYAYATGVQASTSERKPAGHTKIPPGSRTGTVHQAISIAGLKKDVLLIQLVEAEWYPERQAPETRFLDLKSGESAKTPIQLPRVSVFRSGQAVGFSNGPFPRVTVYRWRESARDGLGEQGHP